MRTDAKLAVARLEQIGDAYGGLSADLRLSDSQVSKIPTKYLKRDKGRLGRSLDRLADLIGRIDLELERRGEAQ